MELKWHKWLIQLLHNWQFLHPTSEIKFDKSLFFIQHLKARKLFFPRSFFVSLDHKRGLRYFKECFLYFNVLKLDKVKSEFLNTLSYLYLNASYNSDKQLQFFGLVTLLISLHTLNASRVCTSSSGSFEIHEFYFLSLNQNDFSNATENF